MWTRSLLRIRNVPSRKVAIAAFFHSTFNLSSVLACLCSYSSPSDHSKRQEPSVSSWKHLPVPTKAVCPRAPSTWRISSATRPWGK